MAFEAEPGKAIDFFFRAKPAGAVVALSKGKRDWYASALAKEIDCTFPHIIKVLSRLKQLGLVSFESSGRKKLVFLTAKGKQLAADFSRLTEHLK